MKKLQKHQTLEKNSKIVFTKNKQLFFFWKNFNFNVSVEIHLELELPLELEPPLELELKLGTRNSELATLELELDKTTANTSKRGKANNKHQRWESPPPPTRATWTRPLPTLQLPQGPFLVILVLKPSLSRLTLYCWALELLNVILCDSDVMHNLCHHHLKIDAHLAVVVFDLGVQAPCELRDGVCGAVHHYHVQVAPSLPKRANCRREGRLVALLTSCLWQSLGRHCCRWTPLFHDPSGEKCQPVGCENTKISINTQDEGHSLDPQGHERIEIKNKPLRTETRKRSRAPWKWMRSTLQKWIILGNQRRLRARSSTQTWPAPHASGQTRNHWWRAEPVTKRRRARGRDWGARPRERHHEPSITTPTTVSRSERHARPHNRTLPSASPCTPQCVRTHSTQNGNALTKNSTIDTRDMFHVACVSLLRPQSLATATRGTLLRVKKVAKCWN